MTKIQTKYDSKRVSVDKENIDKLDKCIEALSEWGDKDIGDLNEVQWCGACLGLHHTMLQNIAEILKVVVEETNHDRRTDKV